MSLPQVILPAPLGAGVALGLVDCARHPLPLPAGQAVRLVQAGSLPAPEYSRSLSRLAQSARARGLHLSDCPWCIFIHRGELGAADIAGCLAMTGGKGWFLSFANPRLDWSEGAAPLPAPFLGPAQPGFFFMGRA